MLSSAIGAAVAPWQAGVFRAAAWTARGLRVPARNALLADIVPAEVYGREYGFERAMDNLGAMHLRGSAFGLLATVQAGGYLIASAVAGLLWSAVSPLAAFVFLAAAMVIAAVLIATAGRGSVPAAR